MLLEPNLDSPANVDAAKLFKENNKEYNRKVRRLAEKSLEWTKERKGKIDEIIDLSIVYI